MGTEDYYIDKNYFIFTVRLGYFNFVYKDAESTFSESLLEEEIKNINVKNDSICINFHEGYSRIYKIEK